MRLLQRLRRGEKFSVEERLNEMIDAINSALAIQVGPGLELKHTPVGIAISLAPSMRGPKEDFCRFRRWIQDTEPPAAEWAQGEVWIDTGTAHGDYFQGWMKTGESTVNNDSKVPFLLYQT